MTHTLKIYLVLSTLMVPAILTLGFPQLSGNSKIENRALQDIPKLPASVSEAYQWPKKFDQFTVDRFPFREKFINFFGELFYKMGFSISPVVLVGTDGWLFLGNSNGAEGVLDDYRGINTLSPEELDAWADEFERRKKYLSDRGIKLLFGIIPNKHTVYPDNLPTWQFKIGPTKSDQIVSELERRGVDGVIDLRKTLTEIARKESIYGRYDTHWNYLGAYYAYQEIIGNMPDARQIGFDELVFYKGNRGELSRLIGYPRLTEEIDLLDVAKSNIAFERDNIQGDRKYKEGGWISNTASPELPRAIVLGDSFTDSMLSSYLAPSFNEVLFKHHQRMQFDTKLIEHFNPDYVLYVIVERGIPPRPYLRF